MIIKGGHLEDCIKWCNDHELCKWYTLEKSNDHCLLYEDCPATEDCDTCATGPKYCSRGYHGKYLIDYIQIEVSKRYSTTIHDIVQQRLYFTGSGTEKEAKKAQGKTKPDPWICAFDWMHPDVSHADNAPNLWGPRSPGAGDSKEACTFSNFKREVCKYEFN